MFIEVRKAAVRSHPWPVGNGNDLRWLTAYSTRLRSVVAQRNKPTNSWRSVSHQSGEHFEAQCNDVRLQLRVAADHWALHPVHEPDVIEYMRYPAFCGSYHFHELQWFRDRRGTDFRVLRTVDRVIADAADLGIPLWPSLLKVDKGERVQAFVTGESDTPPDGWIHGTGTTVQLSHGVLRYLPWSCWQWIDKLVERSSIFTGYPLRLIYPMPGEYELAPNCRPLDASDYSSRPRKLNSDEARLEADALLRFYGGGPWVPPLLAGDE